jgi:hypothetical protein
VVVVVQPAPTFPTGKVFNESSLTVTVTASGVTVVVDVDAELHVVIVELTIFAKVLVLVGREVGTRTVGLYLVIWSRVL